MKTPGEFAIERVRALSAYTPGEQPQEAGWIKLNTNENPYPPSPEVARAIARCLKDQADCLKLYPDPVSQKLRAQIAKHHGLDETQVIAGNGSDDILNLLIRAFGDEKNAVGMTVPSYSLYEVLVAMQGAALTKIPFAADMALPEKEIAACPANLFLLTSPNAPTGVGFSNAQLARILETYEGIFVADEAYAPFADESAADLLGQHKNLVVVRTLSKAYGLAGLRVGYALGDAATIGILDRVRDSYNLDTLAQSAAAAAIADEDYLAVTLEAIKQTRAQFEKDVKARGFFAYPSQTNFVFMRPCDGQGRHSSELTRHLFETLKASRILVRAFPNHPLTSCFLRVTIGTPAQMRALNTALDLWQTNAPPA